MTETEVGWGGGGGLGGLRLQACHLFQLSLFCTRGEAVKEEGGLARERQPNGVPPSTLSSVFILAPVIKYLNGSVCLRATAR